MVDPPTSSDTAGVSNQDSTTNTPRWVKVFGIIAILVALLFVVMLLVGGGRHGPSRHGVSDGGDTARGNVVEVGALPEVGD